VNGVISTSLVNDIDRKSLLTVFKKCWKFSKARRKIRNCRPAIHTSCAGHVRLIGTLYYSSKSAASNQVFYNFRHGRSQKISHGNNVEILLIFFRLMTMQCK